jgi:hypothetical protein
VLTTSARSVKGRRFFPLDKKLGLRSDHWSAGVARVATRQGLQAKSFGLAAEAYQEAVGGSMSQDSLRLLTEGWGGQVEAQRVEEAEATFAATQKGERADRETVAAMDPIAGQANLSTDGGMILVRAEGWKEVKLSVISAVVQCPGSSNPVAETKEPEVRLERHSYQAGLWDADTMGQHQFLEGLRRRIGNRLLSSANDGALWIERITTTNYPQVALILDWGHADERLWKVAKAAFGEGTPRAKYWAETNLERLWLGQSHLVLADLRALDWANILCSDDIRQSPAYFQSRLAQIDYPAFRQAGYPIGSGTVESAVNTVVHHRMKRQGRGWKRDNAQAMLAALSELHSHRFSLTWSRLCLN